MKIGASFEKNVYDYLFVFMIFAIIVIITGLSWLNFADIRDTIISQEQQYLLTIADTAAKSIELYFNDVQENLQIIATVPLFQEQFKRLMNVGEDGVRTNAIEFLYQIKKSETDVIQLINREGVVVDQYPAGVKGNLGIGSIVTDLPDVAEVLENRKPRSGDLFFPVLGKGYVSFVEPVFYEEDFEGMIRLVIPLENINQRLIRPIRAGKNGYASVKDQTGILLMHPKSEDIGNNVIDARKGVFPDFDWSELESLVEKQKRGESGVGIYHSIWPTDRSVRVKKFNAYAPAHLGDSFWVVNVSMDYWEIMDMIKHPFYNMIAFALFIVVGFGVGLFNIGKIKKEKEKLEVESFLIYQSRLATMGEMIANIAHQWRQPLSSLSLILSNTRDAFHYNELDEEYMDEQAKKANKLIRKMSDTIDDFRFFFNPKGEKEVFSPHETIVNCVEMTEERLNLKDIGVTVEVLDDSRAFGYRNQFSQVIFNLLNNSIDALVQSVDIPKEIRIRVYDEEAMIVVEITDNGGGIEESMLQRIYDPYFTTKSKANGTGLGLYISRMIVEKNFRGSIGLVNVSGGVRATVKIPKHGDDTDE